MYIKVYKELIRRLWDVNKKSMKILWKIGKKRIRR
jgi:hypothetical protein